MMQAVTENEYRQAITQKEQAEKVIQQYYQESQERFTQRLATNPIFTDDELRYSAATLCPCGHGLAYPVGCGIHHYWDCSAILKGIADAGVQHTDRLPFSFYEIKSERPDATTRGVYKPKVENAATAA